MAARAGVEPTTLQLKVIVSTKAPPRLIHVQDNSSDILYHTEMLMQGRDWLYYNYAEDYEFQCERVIFFAFSNKAGLTTECLVM